MAYANANDEREKVTATVRVSEISSKDGRYVIKSTGGESFSFFETSKKSGKATAAFVAYKKLRPQIGDALELWYAESEGLSRDGHPIIYRNILTIKEALQTPEGEEIEFAGPAPKNRPQPVSAPKPGIRTIQVDEERLESEIIGKTATQFIAAALSSGKVTVEVANSELSKYVMLAERLLWAAKGPSRAKMRQRSQATEEELAGPWDTDEADKALAEAEEEDRDKEWDIPHGYSK